MGLFQEPGWCSMAQAGALRLQDECMGEQGHQHLSQGPTCFPALCGDHPPPYVL